MLLVLWGIMYNSILLLLKGILDLFSFFLWGCLHCCFASRFLNVFCCGLKFGFWVMILMFESDHSYETLFFFFFEMFAAHFTFIVCTDMPPFSLCEVLNISSQMAS